MNLSHLTTEGRNPASETLDQLSSLEIVRLMNSEDGRVAEAVGRIAAPIARAIDLIADRLQSGGRLIYLGAGTSGRLGVLDASECPPTFNSPPWQVVGLIAGGSAALTRAVEGAEDHPELAVADLERIDLCNRDVVAGIATSGRTPYVIGGLRFARSLGAATIGLACNEAAELSGAADLLLIPVVGPEIITGSTRLKAGTATKLVLNMLSTGAMVRLGKTYGNLMVDLQTTNSKLADRSVRIVAALTGLARSEADEVLKRCGGDVKSALIVHQRGITLAEAGQLLESAQGRLRDALERDLSLVRPTVGEARPTLLLGIDGGGSKTRAWLVDAAEPDGKPIAVAEAGPSNPLAAGWSAALANIDLAIAHAFRAASLSRQPVAAACLAVAGTGREAERRRLETWSAQRRFADHLLVTHDALPVLAAGTSAGIGIAVISGTGSLAFGRNECGKTARAGGWGQLLGDDGSGYAIARAGLRAVTRDHDGTGPATSLTDRLCRELNAATPIDLRDVIASESFDAKRIASLAPLVIEAADDGDEAGREIIEEAAAGLARLVSAVRARLFDGSGRFSDDLALSGGLLVGTSLLSERLLAHLNRSGCVPKGVTHVDNSLRGAIALARGLLV